MSLINKMLQDLDARGTGAEAAAGQQEVKAVPSAERDRRALVLGGAALGVLILAAGGWYAWQASHSAPTGPVPKVLDNRIPDRPRFQEPPAAHATITPASGPAADGQNGASNAPVTTTDKQGDAGSAAPVVASSATSAGEARGADTAASLMHAADAHRAGSAKADRAAANAPVADDLAASAKPSRGTQRPTAAAAEDSTVAKPRNASRPASAPTRSSAGAASAGAGGGVEVTPKQMSENAYRRALAALQEGRNSAALADLDKAVEIDPRNDAARQTYVSLLLENKRTDDAIRQLRLALGVDPRQPGLAMVLARLQLEKGGPAALDTLQRTLPYAGSNPDYLAFLAGVLQRDQRHAEAAAQYRNALALAPDNAVWWMGLGISLQADQHLPEAREAYKRARSAPGLTPELKGFIDRKLEQLSR